MRTSGLDRLARKLGRLGPAATRAAAGGLASGAEKVAADARALAPQETGRLDASIVATPATIRGDVASAAVVEDGGHDGRPVAAAVEFGTLDMPAQPHLRPAARRNRDEVTRLVGDAVRDALRSEST